MDEKKYLIILKDKDETAKISSYNIKNHIAYIEFHGKSKIYNYNIKNVIIEENPKEISIVDEAIYHKDMPLHDVKQVLDFGTKTKIIFNKGKKQICDSKDIKIEKNCISNDGAKSILKYWAEISQYTSITDGSEAFLKKEYDKLNFVSPESVLGCYINKEPLQASPLDVNNIIFPFRFNLSQKEALENTFKSNISIIEGPPGTGKTQTILNIIANLAIVQDKKVAVVSGNNAAVKNIQDKLQKNKYDFFVASLGNNENKKRFFENLPMYDIEGWDSDINENELLEKINGLNNRINHLLDLNNQKSRVEQKLSAYRLEKEHFELYYSNLKIEKIKKLSFYRKTPERIVSFLVDNYFAKEKGKSQSILYRLKLLFKYAFTDFKKLKEKEIDIILNLQKEYYSLKIECLEKEQANLDAQLDKGSFNNLTEEHEKFSKIYFENKLYKKYYGKKTINVDIRTYKRNFDKVIDSFPVILSTTHSLRNCIPKNYLFDYLIIDESSQVDLLTGALALSCCKNAIIVGDTKQLPQIVTKTLQEKISSTDIDEIFDYFKHNILSSMLDLYSDTLPKVMLQEHYRCHPKIIEFCNQKYYSGDLIPFTDEEKNDNPLILYRTSKGNHMREVTRGNRKGKFNQRELDVIRDEVLQNVKLCSDNVLDIGVTTPYRKQADRADDILDNEIECDTIHKYQGREKPIIIMSSVLDSSRNGKFGVSFVDDPCKINVAVSRAQKQFVLVTDNSVFYKYGEEVRDLIKYMEYTTFDQNIIDSEIVSVFDLLYKEYSDKLVSLKSRIVKNLKYKSENIIWTVLSDIINGNKYNMLEFTTQVSLKNLLRNTDNLDHNELKFVNRNSSVDFVVYSKMDKLPILIIEVDGFAFHENNPEQLRRDEIKDNILKKYNLPIIRLAITGSDERKRIEDKLDMVLKMN